MIEIGKVRGMKLLKFLGDYNIYLCVKNIK